VVGFLLNVFHVSKCKAWVVTGLKYTEPENEVLCVDMHFCEVVIIIKLCVLDNTLQKLVGPIFASTVVFFSYPWAKLFRSIGGTLAIFLGGYFFVARDTELKTLFCL